MERLNGQPSLGRCSGAANERFFADWIVQYGKLFRGRGLKASWRVEIHNRERFSRIEPMQVRFSGRVSVFPDRRLPEAATPAGHAALIDAYQLSVPVPRVQEPHP